MLAFYRDRRAEDCPTDSLLFQWGTYTWREDSESFEFDITRQFIIGEADDENIWQLSLTFKFPPSDRLRSLGHGNKWCPRPRPQAVDYFGNFIRESAAYQAVHEQPPAAVELDYENAG